MNVSKRGFASMDPERRAEIARKGGRSTKPENRPFAKDKELAKRAGKIGGKISKPGPAASALLPFLSGGIAAAVSLSFCVYAICTKGIA